MEKRGKREKVQYQRSERDFLSYYLKSVNWMLALIFFFLQLFLMWFVRLLQC